MNNSCFKFRYLVQQINTPNRLTNTIYHLLPQPTQLIIYFNQIILIGHMVNIPDIRLDIVIPPCMNDNNIYINILEFIDEEWDVHVLIVVQAWVDAKQAFVAGGGVEEAVGLEPVEFGAALVVFREVEFLFVWDVRAEV